MSHDDLTIWTIGHSTRTIEEFIELLGLNGIRAVGDVRRFSSSRKFPQFNADAMRVSLAGAGIEYMPLPLLGGRRPPRKDSENTVWRNKSFRGYADHMKTGEFRQGMAMLLATARQKWTAIMCAEAVWWRCHRALISDHLKASGIAVRHIIDGGEAKLHPFTSAARIEKGRLTYSPP
jgi:uncharacterized protein (DUF488 family)